MKIEVREAGAEVGRGCFATESIQKGDVIFRESAFAFVVPEEQRETFCNSSLKRAAPGESLLQCQRCKAGYFKDKAELEKRWKEGLKQECNARRNWNKPLMDKFKEKLNLQDKEIPDEVRLVAQVYWASLRSSENLTGALYDYWDKFSKKEQDKFTLIATAAAAFIHGVNFSIPDIQELARMVGKLSIYATEITTPGPEFLPIGIGLYPRYAAMLNHSNSPNSIIAYREYGEASVVALREISPGEEVTVAYTPWELCPIGHVIQCQEQYKFDLEGCSHLNRPLLKTFREESLLVRVLQLHEKDKGRDLQMWHRSGSEQGIDVYIRGGLGDKYTLESIGNIVRALLQDEAPVRDLPLAHPVNMRWLLSKGITSEEVAIKLNDAPEPRIRQMAAMYSAMVLMDHGPKKALNVEEVIRELEPYYAQCGDIGNEILHALHNLQQQKNKETG